MNNFRTKCRLKTDELFKLNIGSCSSSNTSISSSLDDNCSFLSSSDNSSDYDNLEKVIEEYFLNKIRLSKRKREKRQLIYESKYYMRELQSIDQSIEDIKSLNEDNANEKTEFYLNKIISNSHNEELDAITYEDNNEELLAILNESTLLEPHLFSSISSMSNTDVVDIRMQITCRRNIGKYKEKVDLSTGTLLNPNEGMIIISRETSQIIIANDKAMAILGLSNCENRYFNEFLVDFYRYIMVTHYQVNLDGLITYLPSHLISCKNNNNHSFFASILIFSRASQPEELFIILDKVNLFQGCCVFSSYSICECDRSFEAFMLYYNNFLHKTNDELSFDNLNLGPNVILENNSILFYSLYCEYITMTEKKLNLEIGNSNDIAKFRYLVFQNFSVLTNIITVTKLGDIMDINSSVLLLLSLSKDKVVNKSVFNILSIEGQANKEFTLVPGKYKGTLISKYDESIPVYVSVQENIEIQGEQSNFVLLWISLQKHNSDSNNIVNGKPEVMISIEDYMNKTFINKSNKHSNLKTVPNKLVNSEPNMNASQTDLSPKRTTSAPKTISLTDQKQNKSNADLFFKYYEMLNIIGKGAFGYVRISRSKSSQEEFVVKFIRKSKLTIDHMVKVPLNEVNDVKHRKYFTDGKKIIGLNTISYIDDKPYITIPKEICMLCKLDHENIVKLHDWFEGNEHFQLIMTKHGIGMDLFEFIDRTPVLEEPLVSYIFKQLVEAISYLHSMSIAHRDIKDENIILDNNFRIKLIDFGAAVKVEPNQKFKTFCGTMEFCCPEILLGNEYNCFQADIWSMGITLYTIMFGENPFYDFEETVNAVLNPPRTVSDELVEMLRHILEPDPMKRISISELYKSPWILQEINMDKYKFENLIPNIEFTGNVASDFRKYTDESILPAISETDDDINL